MRRIAPAISKPRNAPDGRKGVRRMILNAFLVPSWILTTPLIRLLNSAARADSRRGSRLFCIVARKVPISLSFLLQNRVAP
jgi:hypothetical protein